MGFSTSKSIDAFPGLGVLSHSHRSALCWVHNSLIPVTFSPGPCSVSNQNTVHAALELKRETDDMLLFHSPKARGDASKSVLSKVKPQSTRSAQHHCSNIMAGTCGRVYMVCIYDFSQSMWSIFQCASRSLNINQLNRVMGPCTPAVKQCLSMAMYYINIK